MLTASRLSGMHCAATTVATAACATARPATAAACTALAARAALSAIPAAAAAVRYFTSRAAARTLQFDAAPAAAPVDAAAAAPARPPVSTRAFSKATLRRQSLAQNQPWYLSNSAYTALKRGGFDGPTEVQLPTSVAGLRPEGEMKRLRHEEASRLARDARRVICDFGPGDKIVVSKYLSLNDRTKFERIGGLCLARTKGDRLTAAFIIRSTKLGEDYELRFPLWSPFIARIDMIQPREEGPSRLSKLYRLREEEPKAWEVKVPQGLPKPTSEPQSISLRAKQSEGKVVILAHEPMKKQIKEKKTGGIGAEMAAAEGGKPGAKPAAAAPPKKK